jgi:recombinational DNA repair protein RecR
MSRKIEGFIDELITIPDKRLFRDLFCLLERRYARLEAVEKAIQELKEVIEDCACHCVIEMGNDHCGKLIDKIRAITLTISEETEGEG